MANANAAMGLMPVRNANGSPYVAQLTRYYVPASDGTALYIGDPVIIAGSADADGVPSVTRATAGSAGRITGVVLGFDPDPTIIAAGYRAASTAAYVLVETGNDLVYEIQEDAVGGALAATSVGLNADLIAGNGSPYIKRSGFMLDSSTAATTATLQVRILGFVQRADNEIGANAKVYVRINLPTETGAAGSTGV
ncbi:MAG: hypothetical protein Q7T61_00945 [Caulobacter sp.]|nr:hypothetical protein [Caulobacter sp.]